MSGLVLYLALAGALVYGCYIVITWWEFGTDRRTRDLDPLLDRFLPDWEVAERHEIQVQAPFEMTYLAFRAVDFEDSPIIRFIFRLRQLFMRGAQREYQGPRTVRDRAVAMGWGVLMEIPGRALVLGAVTQPWVAAPVFRALPPDEFAAFNQPGYAKITWEIGADHAGWNSSVGYTETRVKLTDPASRRRFRRYWALVSPGIFLIRKVLLRRVRNQAEHWGLANPPIGMPC
jgi:hypothetical protein